MVGNTGLHERPMGTMCRRLIVEEDTIIPPRTQMTLQARMVGSSKLPQPKQHCWVTEPREPREGLLVARVVLPPGEQHLPVQIVNWKDQPITLEQDAELTMAVPAEPAEAKPTKVDTTESIVQKLLQDIPTDVTISEQNALRDLLYEYTDIFSKSEYDLGQTSLAVHHIDTGDARPIRQTLRRQPMVHLPEIDKFTDDMLQQGTIEPSNSPWAANLVLVTKKDGTLRFCVDYRKLNQATQKDAYPVPRIDACFDAMQGAKWFSTFDLRSGYHQVRMDPDSASKTSFITRTGSYQFKVMPFGLCGAGATFQRVMNIAMAGLTFQSCLVYLDDIIVYSQVS